MYEYSGKVVNIVDGDTIDIEVDLGFHLKITERFRLARINCPEVRTSEGLHVKINIESLLLGQIVKIKTGKQGSFRRWLAEIWTTDGTNINDWLLEKGFAIRY